MLLLFLVSAGFAAERFEGRVFYLGDLHSHTGASGDGGATDLGTCAGSCGAVADVARTARDNGLDFMALTDHSNGSKAASAEDFAAVRDLALAANDVEGGFVTVIGAEVWFGFDGHALGHKNLYVFASDEELAGWTVDDARFDGESTVVESCDDIWAWMEGLEARWGQVLAIPHHPGMPQGMGTDWACHKSDEARYFAPAVEIYSEHGNSADPTTSFDPLWQGYGERNSVSWALDPDVWNQRIGFVGGTDSHDTRPGGVCSLDTEHPQHPYGGGLTVVVLDEAEDFDRQAIHDAIVERRTYATSGPLVPAVVQYESGGAELGGMGEELGLPAGQALEVFVSVPAEWEPLVLEVELVGQDFSFAMNELGDGQWRALVPAGEVPAWLYPEIVVDGEVWYGPPEDGGGCDDGGNDAFEHIWLSPAWVEEGSPDIDGDGIAFLEGDCDDGDPRVHPGAAEDCGSGVDEDCDGRVDERDPDCGREVATADTSERVTSADPEEAPSTEVDLTGEPDAESPEVALDGCAHASAAGWAAWLALLPALVRRRR